MEVVADIQVVLGFSEKWQYLRIGPFVVSKSSPGFEVLR